MGFSNDIDPVAEVLHDLRLEDCFYCRSELTAPWGIRLPERPCASFHFVAEGTAWMSSALGEVQLEAGDLAVLVAGPTHAIASGRRVAARPFASLRDRHLGRALAAMHRRYEIPWTVDTLAAEAGLSRSAFCDRFTAAVGVPPVQYLTRIRMQQAARWLGDQGLSVGEAAQRLGYASEAAFSRAFKRHVGRPPGAARRAGRPTVQAMVMGDMGARQAAR